MWTVVFTRAVWRPKDSIASFLVILALTIGGAGASLAGDFGMGSVDDRVRAGVASGQTMSVIVVCGDKCTPVVQALRSKGLEIDDSAIEMGSVRASIDKSKLEVIETIDGIEAIEWDEDVSTF